MHCLCPCHNPLLREKIDHVESGCPKCVTGSVKECNEAEMIVKEKMLKLCRFEECIRSILKIKDEDGWQTEDGCIEKAGKIFKLAEDALLPTVLCLSCRSLTTKSPCDHCGTSIP